jgi:GntR family transcriptional repressor for pyruvate dehydrogenase complex
MIEPVKKIRLYETIINQLQTLIQEGTLKPGDKLPSERDLAEQMHVSRPSIREALRTLEVMGYIESKVGLNGGSFIKQITIDTIISPFSALLLQNENYITDLLEIRLVLEIEVSRLAALRRTDEDLKKLQGAIQKMEDEIDRGESGIVGDNEFHKRLAEATHNNVLEKFVSLCGNLMEIERESHLNEIEGESLKALNGHKDILRAVKDQDEEAAQASMRMHILNISYLMKDR